MIETQDSHRLLCEAYIMLITLPRIPLSMRWALLSVWNKDGIVDLASLLHKHGFSILSSGGTGALLEGSRHPLHGGL